MSESAESKRNSTSRHVQYVVERNQEVWALIAIDLEDHKYLICTYEDQSLAEEAKRNLQAKQARRQ